MVPCATSPCAGRHVIVGARVEPDHLFGFVCFGRQQNDRSLQAAMADLPADLVSIFVRKHYVELDHVDFPAKRGLDGKGTLVIPLRSNSATSRSASWRLRRLLTVKELDWLMCRVQHKLNANGRVDLLGGIFSNAQQVGIQIQAKELASSCLWNLVPNPPESCRMSLQPSLTKPVELLPILLVNNVHDLRVGIGPGSGTGMRKQMFRVIPVEHCDGVDPIFVGVRCSVV